MMKCFYEWIRYWHPRSTGLSYSNGGFLTDPESEWGKFYNPNVVTFDELTNVRCLILLGEPGTGKSSALRLEKNKIDEYARDHGGTSYFLDLRSYSSEDRIVKDLFENHSFLSWLAGDHDLHLYLDSLDESLLRIDTVATLLVDKLQKYPVERLYLRIACRTADWPAILEHGLQELWIDQKLGIYELAPLRRVDVEQALDIEGISKDLFFHELVKKEAVSLAIKPVTLNFLINSMRKIGQLPRTQIELYIQGCQLLCTETNESLVRLKRKTDLLTPNKRLMVAARIAAVTVFSNRYSVWTATDLGNVPEEDVRVSELSGGLEIVDGEKFIVTEEIIRETLSYGLFSSRGLERLGWAHQTYAEFLAAFYLFERGLTIDQIMSVLIHPADPDRKLIPQLHQTAAWLSNFEPKVIEKIVDIDPVALLNADVGSFTDSTKEVLVNALLLAFDQDKLIDDHEISSFFYKLNHPTLSEQLRYYIVDSSKGWLSRRVAMGMVQSNRLYDLSGD